MPNYTNTVWSEQGDIAGRHPRLEGTIRADVAVVGAGVTGVTAAHLLKKAGKTVAVVEGLRVGKGETEKSTAHLTVALDARYHNLIDNFGAKNARMAYESQQAAIERIAQFSSELNVECGFRRVPGFLYAEKSEDKTKREKNEKDLLAEAEACRALGIPAALTDDVPLPFAVAKGLRFDEQAQINPRAYLLALAATIPGGGSQIFEDSPVVEVDEGHRPCRVVTANGVVLADQVVVAAHVPFLNRFFIHTKIAAYRSYALALRGESTLAPGLFWDTEDPYHYIRTHQMADGTTVLIVGGEDHKVGAEDDTAAPFARLEGYVRERFGDRPIAYRWSGQIIEPVDGLPYIGKNSAQDHVYVATGYAGQGMTGGTLAGMILADQIGDVANPFSKLYDATRIKPLASAKEFVRENVDFPVHLLGDRLHRHTHDTVAQLTPGNGTVISAGGERLAVYRNHSGALSARSAVCTHLGCLVRWNTTEKSWDCPCHGSRFDPSGRVLNGPAAVELPARQVPADILAGDAGSATTPGEKKA